MGYEVEVPSGKILKRISAAGVQEGLSEIHGAEIRRADPGTVCCAVAGKVGRAITHSVRSMRNRIRIVVPTGGVLPLHAGVEGPAVLRMSEICSTVGAPSFAPEFGERVGREGLSRRQKEPALQPAAYTLPSTNVGSLDPYRRCRGPEGLLDPITPRRTMPPKAVPSSRKDLLGSARLFRRSGGRCSAAFLGDAHRNGHRNFLVQLDRYLVFAQRLQRLVELDLAAIDDDALVLELARDVGRRDRPEELIVFARLAGEATSTPANCLASASASPFSRAHGARQRPSSAR